MRRSSRRSSRYSGALLAWPIHGQGLSPIQIAGGLAVVGAVVWVQSQRGALEAELAPAYGATRGVRRSPIVSEPNGRNAQPDAVVE